MSATRVLFGVPKPASDAELEVVSTLYFGTPLHLVSLHVYGGGGSYEVAEDFDSYDPFSGDYDKHRRFWDWVCGRLTCGGVSRASYGQFRCGYRHGRRLERWVCSRRAGSSSSVRPAFTKVSQALQGPGENTPNRVDRGVLRHGRVDGASSSFADEELACATCKGAGELEVGTVQDSFGNWDTEYYPCPDCESSAAPSTGMSPAADASGHRSPAFGLPRRISSERSDG